jgi:MoxR-like ATPase
MSLILAWVAAATRRFVNADDMREVISLALVSGKNLIMFGPGGHGKSEFVSDVLKTVSGASTFVQSCGEGLDEARLYGGINLAKLNASDDPRIEFHPERSFLAADFGVFEELFDAPTSVLLSLKDTLTARCLRNGAQTFPMRTQLLVAATNREPGEVAEMGAAAQALIERFPLQLRVAWESYDSSAYLGLFRSLDAAAAEETNSEESITLSELKDLKERARRVVVPDGVLCILSEIIAGAVASGVTISPRTAVHARDLVRASAAIHGRTTATKEDIVAVKFLPGCAELAAKISSEIEAAAKRAQAEGTLRGYEAAVRAVREECDAAKRAASPIKLLQVAKKAAALGDELGRIAITDNLTDRRKAAREAVGKIATEAQAAALDSTRVELQAIPGVRAA